RDVQHMGFQRGVAAVGAQHQQQVFGGGQLRVRPVDIHAALVDIIVVGVVAIDRQHREDADELEALCQLGLQRVIAHRIVVGGQGQHAAGQAVHQVPAGGFHDNIPDEVGGQVAAAHQRIVEFLDLGGGGQVAQQQQVGGLLK